MNWIHYEEPEASNNNRKTIVSLILRLSRPPKFSFACSSSELRLPSYTRLISRTNSPPSLSVPVRPYRKQRARARGVLLIQYSQWLRLAPLIIIISLCSPMTLPELSLVFLASSPSLSPRHSRRHSWASGAWAALKKSSESAKWFNIDSWEGGREGPATSVATTWRHGRVAATNVRPSVRPSWLLGRLGTTRKAFIFLLVKFRYFFTKEFLFN